MRLKECLTATVSVCLFMDNYFTSFCLFVCLPTLEQEVYWTKIGYANTLSWGTNSCKKKRNVAILNSAAHIKQKRCVTCVVCWNNCIALYAASPNLSNLTEIFSGLEQSWKKVYSTATTKSIPLLQPDWYPNERMVVVPISFNGRCCSLECVGIVLY